MSSTKQEIFKIVEERGVEFIDFQFVDMLGHLKALTVPVSKLKDSLQYNVWFDGSSIIGFTSIFESDMCLVPDLGTFAVIPWTEEEGYVHARFICDVCTPDGEPFEGCPRYILKKQLKRAGDMGYTYNMGPELEFFLMKENEFGEGKEVHDQGGYFDPIEDKAGYIRDEMVEYLEAFGMEMEALHPEVASGQHEINFKYAEALTAADNATTYKYTVKKVAQMHGLHATFMPKPVAGENGSGMHCNQSLFKGSENAFYDKDGQYGLSTTATSFIAGLMKHIKALNAIINPTINSYKRLVPGYEAPVYVAWAKTNRSALIRIPRISPGMEKATRVELRCPDPSANPYLTFAAMLAAGLDGVAQGLQPVAPVEANIFAFDEKELKKHKITTLATSLGDAVEHLKKDAVIKDVLGVHTFGKYVETKTKEILQYNINVTKWELDEYMGY